MSQPYITRDTGEALALRACGLPFIKDPYGTSNGNGGVNWQFTFEDNEQREQVSNHYFAAYDVSLEQFLNTTELYDQEIALVVNLALRLRKEIFPKKR